MPEIGFERGHDGRELFEVAFAIVAEIARALRVEVGVERDLVDAEAAEQLRQHDRGVAPRVVDHDLEAGLLDRVRRRAPRETPPV